MHKLVSCFAVVFFAFILWVIYLANTGSHSVFFVFTHQIPYGDKLGHMGLFGFLTLLTVAGLKFTTFSVGNFKIYKGVVLVGLFVVFEEISQAFIPTRTFDFVDLAADFLGILIAICIAFISNKYLVKNAREQQKLTQFT